MEKKQKKYFCTWSLQPEGRNKAVGSSDAKIAAEDDFSLQICPLFRPFGSGFEPPFLTELLAPIIVADPLLFLSSVAGPLVADSDFWQTTFGPEDFFTSVSSSSVFDSSRT